MRPARRPASVPFLAHDRLRLARHDQAAGAADRPRLVLLLGAACRAGAAVSRSASPAWRPAWARPGDAAASLGAACRRVRRPVRCRGRPRPPCAAASSASCCAASSARRWRASSSAALRASSSRRRASSAADRMEIFSCSRRSASRSRVLALLLDQRALPRRLFGRRQRARDRGGGAWRLAGARAGARGRRGGAGCRPAARQVRRPGRASCAPRPARPWSGRG